ncbi:hypothetical protein [Desulfurococcus mucosus]|uniref:DUF4129 domain-containing protein n=1 Tax=Desulfurococcus mucosus (strain ATCC 35584 / DSM 2162 / JCM 9187 / O7/1) TaxID=765177 RepID=E8R8A2_DESM0|nr:hypothetical protein [Desulfurococcus mucosus]ADV64728.1 hypothetical protein Desmu_0409 [Desulfurococcus mucosus DSM 2162]
MKTWLLLLLIGIPVITATPVYTRGEGAGCLYYLVLLDKAVSSAATLDPAGRTLAEAVAGAPAPTGLTGLHRDAWLAILGYYRVVEEASETAPGDPAAQYRIAEAADALGSVLEYAERLSKCSRDPGAAGLTLKRVEAGVSSMRSILEDLAENLTAWSGILEAGLQPALDAYTPGMEVHAWVKTLGEGVSVSSIKLYTWPSLVLMDAPGYTCRGSYCYSVIEIPDAGRLASKGVAGLVGAGGILEFAFTVDAEVNGSRVKAVKLFKAVYRHPAITVEASLLGAGLLNVSIYSDAAYNASLSVNGEHALNLSLKPGVNILLVNASSKQAVGQAVRVEVCVEPGVDTLPACRAVYASTQGAPSGIGVSVEAPSPVFTWTGTLGIHVVNHEGRPVNITVYAGGSMVYSGPLEASMVIEAWAGPLPATWLSIEVAVQGGSGAVTVYKGSLLVVNTASLTAVAAALTAAVAVARRSLATVLQPQFRIRRPGARGRPRGPGFASRIALLYYDALSRLGVREPRPHETLREHYSASVEPAGFRERVKELLRRLMHLAERDLYSARKVEPGEAGEVYRGVLDAVED